MFVVFEKVMFSLASLFMPWMNYVLNESAYVSEKSSESSTYSANGQPLIENLTISDEPYDEPIELRGSVEGLVYDGYYCWLEPLSGVAAGWDVRNNEWDQTFCVTGIRLSEGFTEGCFSVILFYSPNITTREVLSKTNIYVAKTSWGCFLSLTGMDQANYKARLWGLKHNIITQQEYDEWNAENNNRFVNCACRGVGKPNDDSCLLQWKADNDVIKPLRGISVSFIGQNETISTNADDQGLLSYSNINLQSLGFPVKVRIFAKTKYGTINPVKNTTGVYSATGLLSYYTDVNLDTFLLSESITIKSIDGSVDSGRPSLFGRALGICQAIYFGGKYYEEMENTSPDFVNVGYPIGTWAYHKDLEGIELTEATYAYWDVILHEYGHAVQKLKDISANPGDEHIICYHFCNNPKWNEKNERQKKEDGVKLVWGESWPTVFGNLVTKKYYDQLIGLESVGDDVYSSNGNPGKFSINLNDPDEVELGRLYGEGSEVTTIAVLFDLFDDDQATEPFDAVSLGHKGLWDLVMSSRAKTFSEFATYCYGASEIDNESFGMITGHYGMSVDIVAIANPANFNTLHSPTFSWEKCNKNYIDNSYSSNKYDIEFLAEDGRQIHSCFGLSEESFSPSESDWLKIQANSDKYLRVRVTAYQDNHDYLTGGYLSNIFEFELPNSDLNHSAIYSSSTRLLEDSVNILPFSKLTYQMKSQRDGRRVFQTFGSNDTVMQVFVKKRIVVFKSRIPLMREEWVLIKEDDNSGYENNSLIVIDCLANTDYLVVVRNKNPFSHGQSRLVINQINESKEIGNYSDFNNYTLSGIYLFQYLSQYCSNVFTVRPIYSTIYDISVTAGPDTDTYLYVLDPTSGNQMVEYVEYDDDSNGNFDARLIVNLSAEKDYYVILTQYNPAEEFSIYDTVCISFG